MAPLFEGAIGHSNVTCIAHRSRLFFGFQEQDREALMTGDTRTPDSIRSQAADWQDQSWKRYSTGELVAWAYCLAIRGRNRAELDPNIAAKDLHDARSYAAMAAASVGHDAIPTADALRMGLSDEPGMAARAGDIETYVASVIEDTAQHLYDGSAGDFLRLIERSAGTQSPYSYAGEPAQSAGVDALFAHLYSKRAAHRATDQTAKIANDKAMAAAAVAALDAKTQALFAGIGLEVDGTPPDASVAQNAFARAQALDALADVLKPGGRIRLEDVSAYVGLVDAVRDAAEQDGSGPAKQPAAGPSRPSLTL